LDHDPERLDTLPPGTPTPRDATAVGSAYLLEETIGRGASGSVWRGRRRHGPPVAIKVLHGEYAADPHLVARFLRERTVLQGLRHPHLVRIEDIVVEGDILALVMELVDGESLKSRLRRARLPAETGLTLLADVARALAYVHSAGVLHRDVKPGNVLVARREGRDHALLGDFGLAWVPDGTQLTHESQMVGTPAYLGPEILTDRPVGPATDVYALGVMAYEIFAGERPFAANHPLALMRAHLEDEPARPAGMPDDLWRVIRACLAKQPESRPGAAELAVHYDNLRGRTPRRS